MPAQLAAARTFLDRAIPEASAQRPLGYCPDTPDMETDMHAAAPQPPEEDSLMSEIRTSKTVAAPVQMPEPAAWVYSFTHSSATGKPDLRVDSITTDRERAFSEGHSDQFALYTEHQVRQLLAAQQFTLDELAMLTRKLVQQLRKASPGNESAEKALDYLKRKGLAGNPLRTTQELST